MLLRKRLLEQYVVGAILPYLCLAVLILTVSLLAQQTTRFAEVLGSTRAPFSLAFEILVQLLPNVLVFTLPMAMLIGTATGFSRLSSDSELVSMRAAGVGTWRIVSPVLLTGLLLSVLTFLVGFEVAPAAARNLRSVALNAALYKLESPVEPRSFYTEMPGKVVYVRDGDQESGQWGRVFIHWADQGQPLRLVTARSGRIDSTGERSELVLKDAHVTTLVSWPAREGGSEPQILTERSAQLRIRDDRLDAGRRSLLQRLRERKLEFDEMGWSELLDRSGRAETEAERRSATIALHRRLSLCLAPLVFALLGAALGLRTRRGGRGLGVLLSLAAMIAYYLLSVAGEQLGRAGVLPVAYGVWLASLLSICASALLLISGGRFASFGRGLLQTKAEKRRRGEGRQTSRRHKLSLLGLLDRSLLRALFWSFWGAFAVLTSVFLIFTLFELLRFIAANGTSAGLVLRYMLYLLPFVTISLWPLSMLVAVLLTYALLARRSEAVAWWASGQSVYRLALPGLLFAFLAGGVMWLVQEDVMPAANRRQNALRAQIREGVARTEALGGRQWLATNDARRVYSYEFDERAQRLKMPTVYEFDEEGVHLKRIVWGELASWPQPGVLTVGSPQMVEMEAGRSLLKRAEAVVEPEGVELFKPVYNRPAEQSFKQLRESLRSLKTRGVPDTELVAVAYERRRADPFAPLVMALIGIPLGVAFGKRSALAALSVAVACGLSFWAAVSGFQQLGVLGFLPPAVAAWAAPLIFAALGLYLLSRTRT
ncbi:MAG TPA: LptF/LptG family permease [Pyrinomonadaceae bacterium]|nr:LptF/LptG family permease [Pyrinomonadaceae bacterium]